MSIYKYAIHRDGDTTCSVKPKHVKFNCSHFQVPQISVNSILHVYTFLLTPATGLVVAGLKNASILCCVAPCLLFKIFFTPFLILSSLQI